MTTHPTSTWSESLQQQTRQAIAQLPVTPDGYLHFKHPTLSYAYATIDDLMHDRLLLRSKTGSNDHRFDDVDALLQAGWAVD
ncbi:hypothetical protein [Polaromonas sp.]|uniref:hypothetical protein n=1 Tax=Polaromonas sp. TaxID=1869339 RepID=UPI00286A7843|nr:hypothetical protein [Polaromonas sp.]